MLAAEREVERYSKARWIILIQQWMMTVGWEMNQEALTSPKTPVPLCRRTTVDIRVTYLGLGGSGGGVGGYEKNKQSVDIIPCVVMSLAAILDLTISFPCV